ncbi:MAG TPA: hypothetical protein VHA35_23455 [Dongiaceae bacterium]|jgi:hypothetical protein|nr:hypothetical protein [Dongiaceae bacterium]
MNRNALLLALSLLLAGAATPAFAWSGDSTSRDPSVQSQFSDPDDVVDNLANGSGGGSGTDLSVQSDGNGSAHAVALPSATPTDAEPANPGWPMWMTWHRQ